MMQVLGFVLVKLVILDPGAPGKLKERDKKEIWVD